MTAEPDDTTLMLRYRDGDVEAFERLYARHRGPLFRYFLRHVGHRAVAEELFQEVWTNIIRARDRYTPSAKFTTYMYQIAHNTRIDHYRRQDRRPNTGETEALSADALADDVSAGPERTAQDAQRYTQLRDALAALPAEQRDAFLLREEGSLSLNDIAATTGVTPETAKSRLRYAVAKLRAALGDSDDGG